MVGIISDDYEYSLRNEEKTSGNSGWLATKLRSNQEPKVSTIIRPIPVINTKMKTMGIVFHEKALSSNINNYIIYINNNTI
jgi:hypothetical protein